MPKLTISQSAKSKSKVTAVKVVNYSQIDPFTPVSAGSSSTAKYWSWGADNLLPVALATLSRNSTAHRRVLNDKADYISGRGFSCDENNELLAKIISFANGDGESLRNVINKLAFDKCTFGNAFVEIVTDRVHSFVSLYHQDATRCRVAKDKQHILLHQDWTCFNPNEAKTLPVYPLFDKDSDGFLHSIIHYKDYEPMFVHYGVPTYVAGIGVSTIAYKTDKWNICRLNNSFQLSGVMDVDSGDYDSDEEQQQLLRQMTEKFAGTPGQVLFLLRNGSAENSTTFTPITSSNEGDWKDLHEQSTTDIVVAHSWFRSLSGLDYATGFGTDRILHEYQIALNTVIQPEQQEFIEPIKAVLRDIMGIDCDSLDFINRPPITDKPSYMMIWEARKLDGLDYDEDDERQQAYISTL